jgi:hypothetical protein
MKQKLLKKTSIIAGIFLRDVFSMKILRTWSLKRKKTFFKEDTVKMEDNISVFERVENFEQEVNEALENISSLDKDEKDNLFKKFSAEAEEIFNLLKLGENMADYIKYFQLLPMLSKAELTNEQCAYIFLIEKIISQKKEENKKLEEELGL